jgi:hypothetical protein
LISGVGDWGGPAVAGLPFFFCGGGAFLLGVLEKCGGLLWCFCGEFVVECVVNVVGFVVVFGCWE